MTVICWLWMMWSMAELTACSLVLSSAEVASSSSKILGFRTSARAMATVNRSISVLQSMPIDEPTSLLLSSRQTSFTDYGLTGMNQHKI